MKKGFWLYLGFFILVLLIFRVLDFISQKTAIVLAFIIGAFLYLIFGGKDGKET